MSTVFSFPPITDKAAHTLILGSMPGEKSLQDGQYYAHPRNSFWKVMGALYDKPIDTYPQRVALIKDNGLALWDVLAACIRPGSLDSDIQRDSIEPNNLAAFLKKHPNISRIFFNGTTAEQLFQRHILKSLPQDIQDRVSLHRLPSTSPAMASLSLDKKTQAWRALISKADSSDQDLTSCSYFSRKSRVTGPTL